MPRTPSEFLGWAGTALRGRRVYLALLLFGLVFHADFLGAPFYDDDFLIFTALAGDEQVSGRGDSVWDVFEFSSGDPAKVAALRERGLVPWWTDLRFRMRFARPLAGLGHRLDAEVLGNDPWALHAHSLAWGLAAALAALWVLRLLLGGGWPAGLAAFMFLVAPLHAQSLGWISARNALMGQAFTGLAVGAHLRWRRGGGRGWLVASLVALALGLASNEGTTMALSFALAYAAFLEEGPAARRARGVAPMLGVVLVWWVAYHTAGFGAGASGLYLQPALTDSGFLAAAGSRYLVYLVSVLGQGIGADLLGLGAPALRIALLGHAVLVLAVSALVLRPLLARDRLTRFWVGAAVVAVVPCLMAGPSDRVLGFALVITAGLTARLFQLMVSGPRELLPEEPLRRAALALTALYLVLRWGLLHPFMWPVYWDGMYVMGPPMEAAALGPALGGEELSGRTLVVVAPPEFNYLECIPAIRRFRGRVPPAKVRGLLPSRGPLWVTRTGRRTFEFRTMHFLFARVGDRLYRSPGRALRPGDEVELSDMTYRVLEVGPWGSPTAVRLTFRDDPDHPRYHWVLWSGKGYRAYRLPEVGESQRLRSPPPPLPPFYQRRRALKDPVEWMLSRVEGRAAYWETETYEALHGDGGQR